MLVCLVLCLLSTIGILAEHYAKFLKLENLDAKIEATNLAIPGASITTCFIVCTNVNACVYVSYHEGQHLCHIHEINKTAITSQGWDIYFKQLDKLGYTDMNLTNGASASQSSTFSHHGHYASADLALDGNTDGDYYQWSCSNTDNPYSYWILQFGMSGVVDKVDIYLRSDVVRRNSRRVVMVAQSYDDAVNGVGIECGRYFGPLIVKPPYRMTVQCGGPIFGKFLRISHWMNDIMEICEVIVYTP